MLVCGGTGCTSSSSPVIISKFNELLEQKGIADKVKVVRTGCFGLCENGPIVIVYPEGTYYNRVSVEDVEEIVNEDLLADRPVERLFHKPHSAEEKLEKRFPKSISIRSRSALPLETAVSLTRRKSKSISR